MNRREKAQTIREAALVLFLKRGLDAVPVDDIMLAAKMAKGSFYRYFEDQKALVAEIMEPARKLMTEGIEACSHELETAGTREAQIEAYKKLGAVMATMLMLHPGELRLYLQECRAPATGARKPIQALAALVMRVSIEIAYKAQQHGILRPLSPEVTAMSVVGASERLLLAILREEEVGNPLEIPELLSSLILDGLKRRE